MQQFSKLIWPLKVYLMSVPGNRVWETLPLKVLSTGRMVTAALITAIIIITTTNKKK